MKVVNIYNKIIDLEKDMRRLQLLIANSILLEVSEVKTGALVEQYQEAYHKHQNLLNTEIIKKK